jgi:hypothetical protein
MRSAASVNIDSNPESKAKERIRPGGRRSAAAGGHFQVAQLEPVCVEVSKPMLCTPSPCAAC